ncbi:retrovirus-related pol polyprotein from transposon TNT 1-94 [Tanacetum coccineum]
MVKLNARCSAVLQNELPHKEKVPGSFFLPCTIGTTTVSNALADLGESINIMLFSLFKRLGLENPKPINMVLKMADRYMQSPKGIVENVLVKINKFIFPVNLIILDIIEDDKFLIILGRPMLDTAHARIDVFGIFPNDNNVLPNLDNHDTMFLSPLGSARLNDNSSEMSCNPNSNSSISMDDFVEMDNVWDNLNFRDLTNEATKSPVRPKFLIRQHNTMGPILKISDEDKSKGIHHPYHKIKGFYQGCLELGQFLKELRENTFSGSEHEDANEQIEKVLEIVDLFYIPDVTQDQVMLRAFPMSLTRAASRWLRNEPSDMQEVILFYNGLNVPTRQILDSKGAIHTKTAADAKLLYKLSSTTSGEKLRKSTRKYTLLRSDANYAKDHTTQRTIHSRKKERLLKRLTTHSLEHPINLEDSIEQQGQDSTNATTEILRTLIEDKLWRNH